MSNNKQSSSVEWIVEQMANLIPSGNEIAIYSLQEQAKAMHKKEIIWAISFGVVKGLNVETYRDCDWINRYYNETYRGDNEQQ